MATSDRVRDERGRFLPLRANAADGGDPGTPAHRAKRSRKPASRGRSISWSKAKEAIFFRELAMVCNVTAALRKAKLLGCSSLAYERRKADARFRARWEEAIEQSYAMLELEMLERSRFGDDRPPPANEAERRLRAIPDRLALQLLRLHANRAKARPPAARAPAPLTRARGEALRRELEERLSEFNRRMGGEG
jgi:hypothetical protein